MEFTASALAEACNGTILGDESRLVSGANAIDKAGPNDLSFIVNAQNLKKLKSSQAGIVFVKSRLEDALPDDPCCTIILTNDPQTAFIEALIELQPTSQSAHSGISMAAHIHETTKLGNGCTIYPGVYIDRDVTIGESCTIHPGVVLGPGCRIGNNVEIHANVVCYADTVIGNDVTIQASAVLGADGFGYRFENGAFKKLQHCGRVRIENDVEIGAGTTIDRAMIGETVIGTGTKIDNQVMIAHNCEIGEHNVFASQVGIAGSTTIGNNTQIGGQVGIADHLQIGSRVSIGAKSGLHRDIADDEIHVGYPAGPVDEQRRIVMALQRLPELRKQVRQLSKTVEKLEAQQQVSSETPDLKIA